MSCLLRRCGFVQSETEWISGLIQFPSLRSKHLLALPRQVRHGQFPARLRGGRIRVRWWWVQDVIHPFLRVRTTITRRWRILIFAAA